MSKITSPVRKSIHQTDTVPPMVEIAHTGKLVLVNLRGPNSKVPQFVEIETPGGDKWEITIGRMEIYKLFGDLSELPRISRKHWTVNYDMWDAPDTGWTCTYDDGKTKVVHEGNDFGHGPPVILSYQGEYYLEILAFFLGDFMSNNY